MKFESLLMLINFWSGKKIGAKKEELHDEKSRSNLLQKIRQASKGLNFSQRRFIREVLEYLQKFKRPPPGV